MAQAKHSRSVGQSSSGRISLRNAICLATSFLRVSCLATGAKWEHLFLSDILDILPSSPELPLNRELLSPFWHFTNIVSRQTECRTMRKNFAIHGMIDAAPLQCHQLFQCGIRMIHASVSQVSVVNSCGMHLVG